MKLDTKLNFMECLSESFQNVIQRNVSVVESDSGFVINIPKYKNRGMDLNFIESKMDEVLNKYFGYDFIDLPFNSISIYKNEVVVEFRLKAEIGTQVWIKKVDWELFVHGFIIEGIKDSWNADWNKQCMKKINVSPIEIEEEDGYKVKIRKKY